MSRRHIAARYLPLLLVLLAFFVRIWRLDTVPPGWSDDELSNAFVLSQKAFGGDLSVYYVDATGHEALYHVAAGLMMALFGFNVVGIRLLSVILGTLTVPLTYQMGRRLANRRVGLLAAAILAISFWSLIYSRANIRHISLPVFVLLTLYFFWRGLQGGDRRLAIGGPTVGRFRFADLHFLSSGLFMGVGFYTYFASRGIPLILLALILYMAIFDRSRLRRKWQGILLTFLVALLLAIPLALSLQRQAGADARVSEVAVPLVEARNGNFEPLLKHVRVTLSMFHGDGDDEYLYNIPHRPVFGPVGAVFFWVGVLTAGWYALRPLVRLIRSRSGKGRRRDGEPSAAGPSVSPSAAAFLFLWWLAGITPGFLSVPPASLGHTIAAQPAAYILAALPLAIAGRRVGSRGLRSGQAVTVLLGLLLFSSVALRDLPDYFVTWPQKGFVRFLYHANMKDVARYVQRHPALDDFAISGLLVEPWDALALRVDMENAGVSGADPRWYDPRRTALLSLEGQEVLAFTGYPEVTRAYEELYEPLPGAQAGEYVVARVSADLPAAPGETCFVNGLCLLEARYEGGEWLHLTWRVARPLEVPERPLYSKPPPPGVYAGERLRVFAHAVDGAGNLLADDDGLWVEPDTLRPGDVFRQRHRLAAAGQTSMIVFGLYDPLTIQRILTEGGQEHLQLPLPEVR